MTARKCCGTPRGSGPHAAGCLHESDPRPADAYKGLSREARLAVLRDVGEDLSDGAFFALMSDLGLEVSDL